MLPLCRRNFCAVHESGSGPTQPPRPPAIGSALGGEPAAVFCKAPAQRSSPIAPGTRVALGLGHRGHRGAPSGILQGINMTVALDGVRRSNGSSGTSAEWQPPPRPLMAPHPPGRMTARGTEPTGDREGRPRTLIRR
jgi:hypothetical protein